MSRGRTDELGRGPLVDVHVCRAVLVRDLRWNDNLQVGNLEREQNVLYVIFIWQPARYFPYFALLN